MNEKLTLDGETLREERDQLERQQDTLIAELQSDPKNEELQEELKTVLKRLQAIDGRENTNINAILNKLNIVANFTLAPEEDEKEKVENEASADVVSEYEDIEAIRDVRREIIEKLPLLNKSRFEEYKKRKDDLDAFGDKLKDMRGKQVSELLQKYEDLLQEIEIEIRK